MTSVSLGWIYVNDLPFLWSSLTRGLMKIGFCEDRLVIESTTGW